MTQQFTVNVDVPVGWKIVDFRRPEEGEYFLTTTGCNLPKLEQSPWLTCGPRFILERSWEWPEWLTADYIAMDKNNSWWAYVGEKPTIHDDNCQWTGGDGWILIKGRGQSAGDRWFHIDLPSVDDWKKSLIKNPNH